MLVLSMSRANSHRANEGSIFSRGFITDALVRNSSVADIDTLMSYLEHIISEMLFLVPAMRHVDPSVP